MKKFLFTYKDREIPQSFIRQLPPGKSVKYHPPLSKYLMTTIMLFSFISLFFLVRVNAQPTKQWDKTFGSNKMDLLSSVKQTSDGGFILGGSSESDAGGEKTQGHYGAYSSDYWIVKLAANGTKEWDKIIGGRAGYSVSAASGNKTEEPIGLTDYWVVKLSADRTTEWDNTIGATGDDFLSSIQRTSDGGYVLGCSSSSAADVDKSEGSRGERDYWVVKLASDEDPMPVVLTRLI